MRFIQTVCMLFILLSGTLHGHAQTKNPPSQWQNILPVEGGGMPMKIDSITSLDSLIARLYGNWDLLETGKMYWIGYTDDMFSIAARGDTAIPKLVQLLQSPASLQTKEGAIYTLHLIGIDRTIVGRFSEKFVNAKARTALLQSLNDTLLQHLVMQLLIRDPWLSDVPAIMGVLQTCTTGCWPLVSGLTRYRLNDPPVYHPLPADIGDLKITLSNSFQNEKRGRMSYDRQIKQALLLFKNAHSGKIEIEDTLFHMPLAGDVLVEQDRQLTMQNFIYTLDCDLYLSVGGRIQYYVVGGKLYLSSLETARKRWLDWWHKLSPADRAGYNTYSTLTQQLLKINEADQHYRNQIPFIEQKYGPDSRELKALFKAMDQADSVNVLRVAAILNQYGWLGPDKIGSQANTTLFLVIQHANHQTQRKYLPMLREAVKNGDAMAKDLALLEDRVAVFQGKLQEYGSQLFWSKERNGYIILPLFDPDQVDQRRAAVGLQPLSAYVSKWNIKWDAAEYKKALPAITTEWKSILEKMDLN